MQKIYRKSCNEVQVLECCQIVKSKGQFSPLRLCFVMAINIVGAEAQLACYRGWLKIKYPARQYATSPQPVV